jgi:hypothetical protein
VATNLVVDTGNSAQIGGLVGTNNGHIYYSSTSGKLRTVKDSSSISMSVGGIAGANKGKNCTGLSPCPVSYFGVIQESMSDVAIEVSAPTGYINLGGLSGTTSYASGGVGADSGSWTGAIYNSAATGSIATYVIPTGSVNAGGVAGAVNRGVITANFTAVQFLNMPQRVSTHVYPTGETLVLPHGTDAVGALWGTMSARIVNNITPGLGSGASNPALWSSANVYDYQRSGPAYYGGGRYESFCDWYQYGGTLWQPACNYLPATNDSTSGGVALTTAQATTLPRHGAFAALNATYWTLNETGYPRPKNAAAKP